jgi:hypothetical protein
MRSSSPLSREDYESLISQMSLAIQNQQYISQSNHSLLLDLLSHFGQQQAEVEEQNKDSATMIFFILTCISGLTYGFMDGLDGIVSIVQLLPISQTLAIFLIASFTSLSMLVIMGFDIPESAKVLGLTQDKDPQKPFDLLYAQKILVEQISELMDKQIIKTNKHHELETLASLMDKIIVINTEMDLQVKKASSFLNDDSRVRFYRFIAAFLCALLFLSFGFFTGQAGMLFLLGGITMEAAMSTTFTAALVLSASVITAIGCTCFYWLIQRPGVESLLCKMLYGVDSEKLEELESDKYQQNLTNRLEAKKELLQQKIEWIGANEQGTVSTLGLFHQPAIKGTAQNECEVEVERQTSNDISVSYPTKQSVF